MKRERRQEILWELIDSMFTKVEYWNEQSHNEESLTEAEFDYLVRTISSFAKHRNILNHTSIR